MSDQSSEFPTLKFAPRTPAADELLRRIGRNLICFQQLEALLKALVTASEFTVRAAHADEDFARHAACVEVKTMGTLVKHLNGEITVKAAVIPDHAHPISFRADLPWDDAAQRKACEQALAALTDSRNQLVHHFLPHWRATLDGDDRPALQFLDEQHRQTLWLTERLRTVRVRLDEVRQEMAAFIGSAGLEEHFERTWLSGSRLVQSLQKLAQEMQRRDGWTVLDAAITRLLNGAPDELGDIKSRFGHSNLAELMDESACFEITEEATSRGGRRKLYRVKMSS